MPRVVFDEESKAGLGFEIGQRQQKYQRKPTLQSLANPAVCIMIQLYFPQLWLHGIATRLVSKLNDVVLIGQLLERRVESFLILTKTLKMLLLESFVP